MRIFIQDFVTQGVLPKKVKVEYEVNELYTIGELVHEFKCEQHLVTVNGKLFPDSYTLQEGDLVTMMPHLTGG